FENAGMMFDKETLEPLYKLTIGTSEDSNALFISKKMGIREKVLSRAKKYIDEKDYNLELVKRSKISNFEEKEEIDIIMDTYEYKIGDKVKLLDEDEYAIIYKPINRLNNVEVLYKEEFIEISAKRVELFLKAEELYPIDYDLNTLFISYEKRKLEKDIERGSKKALKKIQKEIKQNRKG
ncbi:MAG: endonuclease MutS2, partial [Romboutsia sp.]